ncbi:MAG: AAA family ATPase [Anaerolineae bacterium]|nr:AAA family ATPase [Anaerolineae bacterium]
MDKNRRLAVAIVLSSTFTLIIGLLSDLAAQFLTPAVANRQVLVWGALVATFLVSLPVAIYLSLRESSSKDSVRAGAPPPAPYARFWGRDALLDELMAVLREPSVKPMIGIDGLGGIGKTAVARELVERSLSEHLFDTVIWEPRATGMIGAAETRLTWQAFISAVGRQLGAPHIQRLSADEQMQYLAGLLKTARILIVLDNLETAATDQAEFAQRLAPLLLPSCKALLTSRRRFTGDVYAVHLAGLDEESSLQLTRHEARMKGIGRVIAASTDELRKIASATGGSPLAIKLIVGQLHHLPLEHVLKALETVRLDAVTPGEGDEYVGFYKSVFWRSWRVLSEEAQRLLISMAVFSPGLGGTLDMVTGVSGINTNRVSRRIDELWRASLVEVDNVSLQQTRYYLHPLTQYFVKSDIVKED